MLRPSALAASAFTTVRPALAGAAAALLALPGHAGVISGEWDPLFGPFLPNLAYQVRAEFEVPQSCSALADGTYAITDPACAGATVLFAKVRLYDVTIDDPFDFETGGGTIYDYDSFGPGMNVTAIRVLNNLIVGVATDTPLVVASFGGVAPAVDNVFTFSFSTTGPLLTCFACDATAGYPAGFINGNPNVPAGISGLSQVLTTYLDDGRPKLTDGEGAPLGALLDENGNFLRLVATTPRSNPNPVPEPGALGLALTALGLMAGVAAGRRRAGRRPATRQP